MDYYNEFDKYPAQWLRNLQAAGHIPQGKVDERSIVDVQAKDLEGVRQAHFFAGVGGWPFALKLAGWPENEPVWTGSCPCQPFSVAGKRKGTKDKRHLWPDFFRLIREFHPPVVFGEQVASKDGRKWLAGVRSDLEGVGYRVGAADLCAAGAGEEGEGWILRGDRIFRERTLIGAPHIRQRLFWVAVSAGGLPSNGKVQRGREYGLVQKNGGPCERARGSIGDEAVRRVDDTEGSNGRRNGETDDSRRRPEKTGGSSFWRSCSAVLCADGAFRRVEPGTSPLANGIPARVGKLRAYGNAIVPQVAAIFIKAYLETLRMPV